jgi:hypothetical protein
MTSTASQVGSKPREDPIAKIGHSIYSRQTRQPSKPAIARNRVPHGDDRVDAGVHGVVDLDMKHLPDPITIQAISGRVEIVPGNIDERNACVVYMPAIVRDLACTQRTLTIEVHGYRGRGHGEHLLAVSVFASVMPTENSVPK